MRYVCDQAPTVDEGTGDEGKGKHEDEANGLIVHGTWRR
jgi:hypothetical protein